ncbi:MAG: hypothetical protein PHW27_13355 [Melioribacteraceae bacterium]|nr:hypothetical protein [Melioribacteraceae bacterium]
MKKSVNQIMEITFQLNNPSLTVLNDFRKDYLMLELNADNQNLVEDLSIFKEISENLDFSTLIVDASIINEFESYTLSKILIMVRSFRRRGVLVYLICTNQLSLLNYEEMLIKECFDYVYKVDISLNLAV